MCVHCSKCAHLDGSNAENKISLLVILCIIMYVKKKKCFELGGQDEMNPTSSVTFSALLREV